MIYLQIFWVFFITNILGYGGGPAIIPLYQHEVVTNFGWMTEQAFAELLAIANTLPGPIAPKLAAYIGFNEGGVLGAGLALFATVVPSIVLMIALMGVLRRHKNSPAITKLSAYIRPTIAAMLFIIAAQSIGLGLEGAGVLHTSVLVGVGALCLLRFRVHPGLVVLGAVIYGGLFL